MVSRRYFGIPDLEVANSVFNGTDHRRNLWRTFDFDTMVICGRIQRHRQIELKLPVSPLDPYVVCSEPLRASAFLKGGLETGPVCE